ncbi:MAG: lipase [Spirochaetes bacterium]|nr:lipase [Spirochaetota bacterium]MBX3722179.1 lipase [Turneriella sp.]
MKSKGLVLAAGLFACSQLFAGAGSSTPSLNGSYPIVFSHGMFGWGANDTSSLIGIFKYWGGMDDYLRSRGAVVYAPGKSALQSNAFRAQELKDKINTFMAAGGYSKVHIIGHSQGGLDSRYMIANLGMASKVSTLTTLSTPHYGAPIADIILGVVPSWLLPFVNTTVSTLTKIVWGGSSNNLNASLNSLTTTNAASFNSTTPNSAGVKYYSYGSKVTLPDLIQHPLMGLLVPITGVGGVAKGQGLDNDGLVPLSSAKWGTWKGSPSYGILTTGLDHLEVSNTLSLGEAWFDVRSFWLTMAVNAKSNQ